MHMMRLNCSRDSVEKLQDDVSLKSSSGMHYDVWYYIKDWVLNVILDKGATDTNVIG